MRGARDANTLAVIRLAEGCRFQSAVDPGRSDGTIAPARCRAWAEYGVKACLLLRREFYRYCGQVFFQARAALGARYRHDIIPPRKHPGQSHLSWRITLRPGDFFQTLHQCEVLLKIFVLETRMSTAPVIRGQVIGTADLPGEETAAQRRVGDETDPKLSHGREDAIIFRLPAPKGIFALQRRYWMHCVRAPDGLWPRF